jgi:hypothetical protein
VPTPPPGAHDDHAAPNGGSGTLSGGSEAVIEILHMSPGRETSAAAAARERARWAAGQNAGRATAQGAHTTSSSSSSSKMGRRQRNRSGRPHYQQRQHLAKQYSNILDVSVSRRDGCAGWGWRWWLEPQPAHRWALLFCDPKPSQHAHLCRTRTPRVCHVHAGVSGGV